MAKALFQRHQRVWVECIGAWAVIEKIIPTWAKGFGEPVRVTYDLGLGREFLANELRAEPPPAEGEEVQFNSWRILRARNKWQQPEDCVHHPFPGTFPVLVTDSQDWGGWRVPGAEYDRDPHKIEAQARVMASSPGLLRLARDLLQWVAAAEEETPLELQELADHAQAILRFVADAPPPPEELPERAPLEEPADAA
jgi:hypothetical protein